MTGALLDHLWQSTLFCAAIWSITRFMRGNSAAVRHWLWLAASLKFLLPFSALYLLGAAAGIHPPLESQPAFFSTAIDAAVPVVSPAVVIGAETGERTTWPAAALLGGWLLGALFLTLRWARDWRNAYAFARAARPAPGTGARFLLTDADMEPSVARMFRPVVVLPAALLGSLQASRLEAVLAHELAHVARHDILKLQLHRLVEMLFWFHPAVWLIGRKLLEERERACDEAVLARGHEPGEYAAAILDVCRHCTHARGALPVSALAGDLPRRIGHILAARPPVSLGFCKAFTLSMAAFLLAATPLLAGSIDSAMQHRVMVERDMRILWNAGSRVLPAVAGADGEARISAADNMVSIHNSSLRELLALAYGVEKHHVGGRGEWLDTPRYDIHAVLPEGISRPEDFDPVALRGFVNKLLAVRFNFEIHVNHRCQHPCGPRALLHSQR